MANAKVIMRKIREKREMFNNLRGDMEDLEGDMIGMELEYEGNFAIIESVDGEDLNVTLYIELEDGRSYYEKIHFSDLEEWL